MKRVAIFTAIVLLTITVLLLAWQLHGVALIVLVSLAISATLGQPIEWLAAHGWGRGWAIGAVYIGALLVVFGLFGVMGYLALGEIDPLVQDLVNFYGNVQNTLMGLANPRTAWVERLPSTDQIARWWAGEEVTTAMQNVAGMVSHSGRLVGELVLSVFLSLYWTADRNRFERLWFSLLAAEQRIRTRRLWRKLESDVGAYLRSEIVQTVLAVLLFAIGYSLMGVKYPYILALLAGLLWLAPLLGGFLALLPVVIVGLLSGPVVALAALAYTVLVLAVLEFYVQKRLYTEGRYWGVLLVVIMLATVDAFGFVGLLLSAPIAVALQIGINEFLGSPAQSAPLPLGNLEALQNRLNDVRNRIQREGEQANPRLVSLVERLEALISEVESTGVHIEATANQPDSLVAGNPAMGFAKNNI